MDKLFIAIRQDLPPKIQAVQACHALQAMNDQHPETIKAWGGNLVLLGVKDTKELSELHCRLQRAQVPVASFCEPDLEGQATSLAIDGRAWKQLSSLPLALRDAPLRSVA